jgi:hypothetical protein
MKEVIILVDDSGAKLTFHIQQAGPPMTVERHKSWVEHEAEGVGRTGMTEWHNNAEDAALAITKIVADMLEMGWKRI